MTPPRTPTGGSPDSPRAKASEGGGGSRPTLEADGASPDPHARPGPTVEAVTAPLALFTDLFPPEDGDVAGHRSWLARCPWPEVVFASAR